MKNFKNEKAVSPVIGVILMVVITVIIAAVLAVFAFGIGAPAKAPTASVKIVSTSVATATTNPNTITIAHTGGDTLILSKVKLIVEQTDSAGLVTRMSVDQIDTGINKFKPGDQIRFSAATGVGYLDLSATALVPGTLAGAVTLTTGSDVVVTLVDVPTGQEITSAKISI